MTQKQKLLLDDYAVYHQELARTQFEVADLEGQLAAQEAMLKNVDAGAVPAEEVDMLLLNDPVAREMAMQLAVKKQEQMINKNSSSPDSKNHWLDHYRRDLKNYQDAYDEKVEEVKKKVRERKHSLVEMEAVRVKSQLSIKRQHYDILSKQVHDLKEECAKFGSSTVDIEMARSNLKLLEAVYSELNGDREKVKVEMDSAAHHDGGKGGGSLAALERHHTERDDGLGHAGGLLFPGGRGGPVGRAQPAH